MIVTLKIKYIGGNNLFCFTNGKIYKAKEFKNSLFDEGALVIYDDGHDWYPWSGSIVRKNFQIIERTEREETELEKAIKTRNEREQQKREKYEEIMQKKYDGQYYCYYYEEEDVSDD